MKLLEQLRSSRIARPGSLGAALGLALVVAWAGGCDSSNQGEATSAATSAPAPGATPAPNPVAEAKPVAVKTLDTADHKIQTVFVILMENHNWADIKGNASAPYLNSLLDKGAHAEQYYNPPGLHPSLPNYIWLEAGSNLGVTDDALPQYNHQSTHQHLVNMLEKAGISWKSYQEDYDGEHCPLTQNKHYAPRHDPMVYFDDVTDTNSPGAKRCIAHVRPMSELDADLQKGPARYNFITPNVCNDMHDSWGCQTHDSVHNGDQWLSKMVPKLMASDAYKRGGAIFITWDEGAGSDGPIGMIVLSPFAKKGYANQVHYTHGSTLRTVQEIFGVRPFLGDAAKQKDLSDLFSQFP